MAEVLQAHFGLKFESSSMTACRLFLFDALKDKYGYTTIEECYQDRVNHRAEWYDLICEYNKEDPAKLAKGIMAESDIYVGMRDQREIEACQLEGLFDLTVGVYRPGFPLEDKSSFNIDIWEYSDFVIPNASNLFILELKILHIFRRLGLKTKTPPINYRIMGTEL